MPTKKEEETMPKLILEQKFLLKKEQLKLRMSLSKARCPIVQEALKKRLDAVTQQLEELTNLNEDEVHFLRAPEFGITCCIMYEKTDSHQIFT